MMQVKKQECWSVGQCKGQGHMKAEIGMRNYTNTDSSNFCNVALTTEVGK